MQKIKRSSKRILCVVVTLVMVLALLPVVPLAAEASEGHVLDLSNLPTESCTVWSLGGFGFGAYAIRYLGEGPLTIRGSNSARLGMIGVPYATQVYIEDNTVINTTAHSDYHGTSSSNSLFLGADGVTLHGLGSNITINNETGGDVISASYNVTVSGTFGNMLGGAIGSNGQLYISATINSIITGHTGRIGIHGNPLIISGRIGSIIADVHGLSGTKISIIGEIGNITAGRVERGSSIGTGIMSVGSIRIDGTVGNITAVESGIYAGDGSIRIDGTVGSISSMRVPWVVGGWWDDTLDYPWLTGWLDGIFRESGSWAGIIASDLGIVRDGENIVSFDEIIAGNDIEINGTIGSITNFHTAIAGRNVHISGSVENIIGHSHDPDSGFVVNPIGVFARNDFEVAGSGSIGGISNVNRGIYAFGNVRLNGSIPNIIADMTGIISDNNIHINSPVTVSGGTSAFSHQPNIGIAPAFSATWSSDVSGLPIAGSSNNEYIWSAEHRWVRISESDQLNDTLTDIDDDTGISLVAPPGTVPPDTELVVTPVTEGGNFVIINNALAQTSDKWVAFDINLISGGQRIQPDGYVTITIPRTHDTWQGFNMNKLAIFHVAEDGTLTLVEPWPVELDDTQDNIIIRTNRFSFFAISELTDEKFAALLAQRRIEPPPTAATTVFGGTDYALVYHFEFYMASNPDLGAIFGGNPNSAIAHFVNHGMREGRLAHPMFDVRHYRNANPDLRAVFGNDLRAFFMHYIRHGHAEGREFTNELVAPLVRLSSTDYSLVYNMNDYLYFNPDLREVFGENEVALLAHFVNHGMREGRQAHHDFNVHHYRNANPDLRAVFGNDLRAFYMHYVNHGHREGRPLSETLTCPITVRGGIDYSLVYNMNDYLYFNPDLREVFGENEVAVLAHFVNHAHRI